MSRGSSDGATAWEVVQRSRLVDRPVSSHYLALTFAHFVELHGDRQYRDDPAIRGGLAVLLDQPVIVVGQERGRTPEEHVRSNFGMAFPEGFRKAQRLIALADRFGLPIVTLVDTPGAYPGLGAEERGQAHAIAQLLACMASVTVPTVSVIIGQGGSGGALALALADRVLMLENSTYSVISPEGCASILWQRADRAPQAAAALCLTAADLSALGLIDEVIAEPAGGIGRAAREAAVRLRRALVRHLGEISALDPHDRIRRREARYAGIGVYGHCGEDAP